MLRHAAEGDDEADGSGDVLLVRLDDAVDRCHGCRTADREAAGDEQSAPGRDPEGGADEHGPDDPPGHDERDAHQGLPAKGERLSGDQLEPEQGHPESQDPPRPELQAGGEVRL